MRCFTCVILAVALFVSGCTRMMSAEAPPDPVEVSESEISSVANIPALPVEPSCVEVMANQAVSDLVGKGEQGEQAVRALYEYLIREVWFSDPVGLDAWRYLPPYRQEALPYLENRAFSPLQFGIGSCEDFAAALVLLLRAAGFRAEYVAGYTLSVEQKYIDHAWAVVFLDGQWYHLDPQLEQNVIRGNLLTYRYYLKSDSDYAVDHKWGENLIVHWPEMPEHEKAAIRERHTPPLCPAAYPSPESVYTALPLRPNQNDVEQAIEEIKRSSGMGQLPPIPLNVEPPVLVAAQHITPPLLESPVAPVSGYGRSFLSGAAATLYDSLPALLDTMKDGAVLDLEGSVADDEALAVISTFLSENPLYYWAKFDLIHSPESRAVRLNLTLPAGEIARRQDVISARANELIAGILARSDFEKALAIHDTLAVAGYDRDGDSADSPNLYGVLVEGKAICNGYAAGFHYLAGLAGLESVVLEGVSTRGIPHAWNAVRLDGSWHYVDVTWDRPLNPDDGVYHDYFLMSAQETNRERIWEAGQYPEPPDPSGGFAGYYERMGYAVSGPPGDSAVSRLAGIFYKQLAATELPCQARPVFLELKVSGGTQEYEAWKELYVKELFAIQRAIQKLSDENGGAFLIDDLQSVKCDFNDTTQVLTLYPIIKTTAQEG
jgi:transglutaminase-like putative cysteine protease